MSEIYVLGERAALTLVVLVIGVLLAQTAVTLVARWRHTLVALTNAAVALEAAV